LFGASTCGAPTDVALIVHSLLSSDIRAVDAMHDQDRRELSGNTIYAYKSVRNTKLKSAPLMSVR
jgi:hypothetical protein